MARTKDGYSKKRETGSIVMPSPNRNHLLGSIPQSELEQILRSTRLVEIEQGAILHEPGEVITQAYFPVEGFVSLLAVMKGKQTAEVGVIGNEGLIGSHIILGAPKSARRALVQHPFSAYSISANNLRQAFQSLPEFRARVLRYVRAQGLMASQIAACNGLHNVQQRLAMWLLTCHDRSGTSPLPFTQNLLAEMLGLKRTTVTEAARILYKGRLIEYSRGYITILKRRGLERRSCECYQLIRDHYDTLLDG